MNEEFLARLSEEVANAVRLLHARGFSVLDFERATVRIFLSSFDHPVCRGCIHRRKTEEKMSIFCERYSENPNGQDVYAHCWGKETLE